MEAEWLADTLAMLLDEHRYADARALCGLLVQLEHDHAPNADSVRAQLREEMTEATARHFRSWLVGNVYSRPQKKKKDAGDMLAYKALYERQTEQQEKRTEENEAEIRRIQLENEDYIRSGE